MKGTLAVINAVNPEVEFAARVSYSAAYYDKLNRLTDAVDVGTNGAGSYTRPGSVPSRSDTALVSSVEYDAAGRQWKTTDPRGLESRTTYDLIGRTIKTVENYVDGTVSDLDDKTTEYTYSAAGMTSLTAKLTGLFDAEQLREFLQQIRGDTVGQIQSRVEGSQYDLLFRAARVHERCVKMFAEDRAESMGLELLAAGEDGAPGGGDGGPEVAVTLGLQEQINGGVAHRQDLEEDVAFERIELGRGPGGPSGGFFEVHSHRGQAIGLVGRRVL